jgi:hypothetical protein
VDIPLLRDFHRPVENGIYGAELGDQAASETDGDSMRA